MHSVSPGPEIAQRRFAPCLSQFDHLILIACLGPNKDLPFLQVSFFVEFVFV